MTTNDYRINVPSLEALLDSMVNFATTYPEHVTPHAYITRSAQTGEPLAHDLIAHAYKDLGGNLDVFLGTREATNTPRKQLVTSIAWEYMFKGQPALFLDLRTSEQAARNLLVYWTLGRVQKEQDKSYAWKPALRRGLMSARSLINHKYSGFLVQTHGQHVHVRDEAVFLLTDAIKRLS